VKEAGRGSHVTLGFEGNEFTRSSRYQAEFCDKHKEAGGEAIKTVTANMVSSSILPACTYGPPRTAKQCHMSHGTQHVLQVT
jgi:hypothetical protein